MLRPGESKPQRPREFDRGGSARRRSGGGTGHPFTVAQGWAQHGSRKPRGRHSTNRSDGCEAQNTQDKPPQDWRKIAGANPFRPATSRNAGRPSGVVSLDPAIETNQKRNARATLPGITSFLVEGAGACTSTYVGAGIPSHFIRTPSAYFHRRRRASIIFLACVPRFRKQRSRVPALEVLRSRVAYCMLQPLSVACPCRSGRSETRVCPGVAPKAVGPMAPHPKAKQLPLRRPRTSWNHAFCEEQQLRELPKEDETSL
jgi:hypothetical protein